MAEKYKGTIIKGIGGFYYVRCECGIAECRARGRFRRDSLTPLVGDIAEIELDGENSGKGVIQSICERKNALIRPAVANVSQLLVVAAVENPRPNTYVLDKLIASAEYAGLDTVICFNKSDLNADRSIAETYENAGFHVVVTSAEENVNIDGLRKILKDKITVFAGNSGVGKSSLLNKLLGEEYFETGEVSRKVERGRHTTRHSELAELPFGGYIIDTPGFSSFDLSTIPSGDIGGLFREFAAYEGQCRFPDCVHIAEPGCAVLAAVNDGRIAKSRHESYKLLFEEAKAIKPWEQK